MRPMTLLPRGRPLTAADLAAMPDDGHRHELLDGTLVVTPAPHPRHQIAAGELYARLRAACLGHAVVLFAPVDVRLSDQTVLQPDLLVASRDDLGPDTLSAAPLLAVEILSPSTRLFDLTVKKAAYERAGCPAYWVLDLDRPGVKVWELADAASVLTADVSGDESVALHRPFPVTIRPRDLVEG